MKGGLFRRVREAFSEKQCVFPMAVKPWQKIVCGIAGVSALGAGVFSIGYVFVKAIEGLVVLDYKWTEYRKLHPAVLKVTPKEYTGDPAFVKYINRLLDTKIDDRVKVAVGVFASSVACVVCAVVAIKNPLFWWHATKEEFGVFFKAIKGTECCNIVRKTARFAVTGPVVVSLLLPVTLAAPGMSIACAGFAIYLGKDFIQNSKAEDDEGETKKKD